MTRRHTYSLPPKHPLEDEFRRVKDELWMARRDIVELMPSAIRDILTSYYSCDTEEAARGWRRGVVDRLIQVAEAKPPEEMGEFSSFSQRALCPLCGEGSQNPFGIRGFAVPEGLNRHLEGSHNSQQCRVFHAAWHLARDFLLEKFPYRNG